jgi:hypothetical protein
MTVSPRARGAAGAPTTGPVVTYGGAVHPAEELARGAAYELFSDVPLPGFEADPRPDARAPWHRFVHVSEVTEVRGRRPSDGVPDSPLMAPLNRTRTFADVFQLTQSPAAADDPVVAAVRGSALIRRGTPMLKVLSARQLAGFLRGRLPHGFCHREFDVAHLRTPADLAGLYTDAGPAPEGPRVAYAIRWRAVDPLDYETGAAHRGLTRMAPGQRLGPPVTGTGFVPGDRHLVPEFVTRDFADLPLPAGTTLLAFTPEGAEVVLYTYQPDQRGWLRMAGPRWRHLLAAVPGCAPDQEYVPVDDVVRASRLFGTVRGEEHEAVADPPEEFRVLAMTRDARHRVETVSRRHRQVVWRGVTCAALRADGGWVRLRLCRPDPEAVRATDARCYERGVYEVWAPRHELDDPCWVDVAYPM